jgi:hypothetical protein
MSYALRSRGEKRAPDSDYVYFSDSDGETHKLNCPECRSRFAKSIAIDDNSQAVRNHFNSVHAAKPPAAGVMASLKAAGHRIAFCYSCNKYIGTKSCRRCAPASLLAEAGVDSDHAAAPAVAAAAAAAPAAAGAPAAVVAAPVSFSASVSAAEAEGLSKRTIQWLKSVSKHLESSAIAQELAARSPSAAVRCALYAVAGLKGRSQQTLPQASWPYWRQACRPHLNKFRVAASADDDQGMINAIVALLCTARECLVVPRRGGKGAAGKEMAAKRLAAHLARDCFDESKESKALPVPVAPVAPVSFADSKYGPGAAVLPPPPVSDAEGAGAGIGRRRRSIGGGADAPRDDSKYRWIRPGYVEAVSSDPRAAEHNEDVRKAKRAAFIARSGRKHALSRAAKSLVQSGALEVDEKVLRELQTLHPPTSAIVQADAVLSLAEKETVALFDRDRFLNIVRKSVSNGSSPGPSGLTGEMLEVLVDDNDCCDGLFAIVNALVNGRIPVVLYDVLLCSWLLPAAKKRGGVRPIAMGESLWKMAVSMAMDKIPTATMGLLFPSIQLGVGVHGGTTIAVHKIQSELSADSRRIALFTDIANAFNCVDRAMICKALANNPSTKPVWHLFKSAYADRAAPLIVKSRAGSSAIINSVSGVRQGDVFASFLFALAVQPLFERAVGTDKSVVGVAIYDDLTLIGEPERVLAAFQRLADECGAFGLTLAKQKCVALFPAARPSAAVEALFVAESVKVLGGQWHTVLGAAVGSDQVGISEFVKEVAGRHDELFRAVKLMDPQTGLLILRACGLPRFTHIVRCIAPRLTGDGAQRFDDRVFECFQQLSGIPAEWWAANPIARLRFGMGRGIGVGLRPFFSTRTAAFLAAATLSAPHINKELIAERTTTSPFINDGSDAACSLFESGPSIIEDVFAAVRSLQSQVLSCSRNEDDAKGAKDALKEVLPVLYNVFTVCGVTGLDIAPKSFRTDSLIDGEPPAAVEEKSADPEVSRSRYMRALFNGSSDARAAAAVVADMRANSCAVAEFESSVVASHPSALRPDASSSAAASSSHVVSDRKADNDTAHLQRRLVTVLDGVARAHLLEECRLDQSAGQRQKSLIDCCSQKGAARWLYIIPAEPRLVLSRYEFGLALRLMFGAPCGGTQPGDRCLCGIRPLLSSLSSDHLLTCGELRSATNARHDEILRCLQMSCRELCMGSRWKPQFFNSESKRTEIPDLEITAPGLKALIDVSVVHSSAASVAGMSDGAAVQTRALLKKGKYDRSSMMVGAVTVPFVVDSHGFIGADADHLLNTLARLGADYTRESSHDIRSRLADCFSIAIMRGHAALVAAAEVQCGCPVLRAAG